MLRLLLCTTIFATAALGFSACGGDDGDDDSSSGTTATEQAEGSSAAGDPRETIQEWFTAARLGETADKCALESEEYQVMQYQESGQACLDDLANTQPQPVWAKRTVIKDLQTSGNSATAVVQPNASTPAEATVGLTREGDGWLIASFQ